MGKYIKDRPRWTKRKVKRTGRQTTRKFDRDYANTLRKEHMLKKKKRYDDEW